MIDLLNPQNMTDEDWQKLQLEADQIIAEVNSDPDIKNYKLSQEDSDKMYNNIKAKIKEYEDYKAAERFLNFVFGDDE